MIRYEWDVETRDEHGDVLDHDHRDSYGDALRVSILTDEPHTIVLVRDHIDNETFDLLERRWAYMGNGALPEYFQDSAGNDAGKVPQNFIAEVKRAHKMMGVTNDQN